LALIEILSGSWCTSHWPHLRPHPWTLRQSCQDPRAMSSPREDPSGRLRLASDSDEDAQDSDSGCSANRLMSDTAIASGSGHHRGYTERSKHQVSDSSIPTGLGTGASYPIINITQRFGDVREYIAAISKIRGRLTNARMQWWKKETLALNWPLVSAREAQQATIHRASSHRSRFVSSRSLLFIALTGSRSSRSDLGAPLLQCGPV
jgi:hypothetical protein